MTSKERAEELKLKEYAQKVYNELSVDLCDSNHIELEGPDLDNYVLEWRIEDKFQRFIPPAEDNVLLKYTFNLFPKRKYKGIVVHSNNKKAILVSDNPDFIKSFAHSEDVNSFTIYMRDKDGNWRLFQE